MTHHFDPSKTELGDRILGTAISRARSALNSSSSLTRFSAGKRPKGKTLSFDPLEKRYLLSADISPFVDTLDDGLDRLEALADDLEAFEDMAAAIPVLGASLGEVSNLSGTLRSELIDPIQALLDGTITDSMALATEIGNIAGVTVSITTDDASSIVFDVEWTKQIALLDQAFDLGDEAAGLNIELDGDFDFMVDLSIDFGFGVLLDPGLSPTDAFFIEDGGSISVSGASSGGLDVSAGGVQIGLLGEANLDAASTFDLSAGLTATLDGGGSNLTAADIDAGGIGLVTLTEDTNSFAASLLVDSSALTGLTLDDAGVDLTVTGDFFESPDIEVEFVTPDLEDFVRANASLLLTFLGDLGGKLESLATAFNDLADVDFLDIGIGDLTDYNDALRELIAGLSVPGLLGALPIDLAAGGGGNATFIIEVTTNDPTLATPIGTVGSLITVNFANMTDEASIIQEFRDAFDAAADATLANVEAFINDGQLGIRAITTAAGTETITDLVLRNVSTEVGDAFGLQTDQTGFPLPTFETIQEFTEKLVEHPTVQDTLVDINLRYDAPSSSLLFNINVLNETFAEEVTLAFEQSLELLGGLPGDLGTIAISGAATAMVDADVNFAFGAGLDLTELTGTTSLADLNGGLGVGFSQVGGIDLAFQASDGTSFDVTFDSGDTTIADIIDAINTAVGSGGAVVASIDGLGSGLVFTDTTGGDATPFAVSGGANSNAIFDLGFAFGAAAPEGVTTLTGAALIERFFIDEADTDIGASVSASASDINLFGSLGFLTFGIQGGTLTDLAFDLSLDLVDPDMDGRIHLSELGLSAADSTPVFEPMGSGDDLTLDIETNDGTVHTINFTLPSTMQEALGAIETQTGGDVSAILSAAGNSVILIDNTIESGDIGDLRLNGNPTEATGTLGGADYDADTVSIGGVIFEFDDGVNGGVEVDNIAVAVGGSAAASAANLAAAINTYASTDSEFNFSALASSDGDGDFVRLSHAGAPGDDPSLRSSLSTAGSVWQFRTFTVSEPDGASPGDDSTIDTAAEALGFGRSTVDVNGDGVLNGDALAGAGFAAFGGVNFVDALGDPILDGTALLGTLTLPIVFDDAGALGLDLDPINLVITFEVGSIVPIVDIDGEAFEQLFQVLTNLGAQDLLAIVGDIANILINEIDLFQADLPLLDSSIADLIQLVQTEFDGVIETFNTALREGLETAVNSFESAFTTLVDSTLSEIDAQTFLNSFEGQTILAAIEDIKAEIPDLSAGFDFLFDDVPGKLLSAVAAIQGAVAMALDTSRTTLDTTLSNYAALVAALEGNIGDLLDDISDISPSTETVLRLIQQALGFDLPTLDEPLPQSLADLVGDQLEALLGLNPGEAATKTVAELIASASNLLDTLQDTTISAFENFLADIDAEIGNAPVDDYLAELNKLIAMVSNASLNLPGLENIDLSSLPANGLANFDIELLIDGATEIINVEIDYDRLTNAANQLQDLVDQINEQIDAVASLADRVTASLDGAKLVLQGAGEDLEQFVLNNIDATLQAILGHAEGAITFFATVQDMIDRLAGLDGAEDIFDLIQELPFISDIIEKLTDLARPLLDIGAGFDPSTDAPSTLLEELINYASDNGLAAVETAIDSLIAEVRAFAQGAVDDVRASVMGLFGGGVMQFDVDIDTGVIDLGFFLAPTLFSANLSNAGAVLGLDNGLFTAGIDDANLNFELGGVIDLGARLDLGGGFDGGFGSDFDIAIGADSNLALTASLELEGDLVLAIGAVGVVFKAVPDTEPIFALTDLSGEGPAFLRLGIDGDADMDGFVSLVDETLGFTITGEALLSGEAFAFTAGAMNPIEWDNMGSMEQVDIGISASIDFSGGDFGFDFDVNTLTSEELDAILATFTEFSFDNLVNAFLTILDFIEVALGPNGLGAAPVIGGELVEVSELIGDFRDQVDQFIADLTGFVDDTLNNAAIVDAVQGFLWDTLGGDGIDVLFEGAPGSETKLTNEDQISVRFIDMNDGTDLADILDVVGKNAALLIDPLTIGFALREDNDSDGNMDGVEDDPLAVDFDFGLDALVLEVESSGNVLLDINTFFTVGFGLSVDEGAFLIIADELDNSTLNDATPTLMPDGIADPILTGDFDAELSQTSSLFFSLFFLGLEATPWQDDPTTDADVSRDAADREDLTFDDRQALQDILDNGGAVSDFTPNDPTGLGVGFDTDLNLLLTDGTDTFSTSDLTPEDAGMTVGGDLIAPVTQLGDFGLDIGFDIEVNIDLMLSAGIASGSNVNDNLPTIETFLNVDWMWDPFEEAGIGATPGVQFYDLRLDMGEWIENTIGGLLDSIQTFTAPLQPFLDFLDLEIPIISQLSELFGQGTVTFLDAIGFLGSGIESIEIFLEILDTIDTILDFIDTLSTGTFVNFGDLILSENPGLDLRDIGSRETLQNDSDFGALVDPSTNTDDPAGELSGSGEGGFFDEIFDSLAEVGVSLPFLEDPFQLFGLLFGQNVDFVIWDIPRLEAEFGVSYKFGPILPPVPLFVTIGGGFNIFLDLTVGYDSRGLETGEFFDGFFFRDFDENGNDVLELGLSVFFEATASLSVVVAEAGVTGGVEAEIGLNWHDPNNDGKFYLDELVDRFNMGILCIFDLEGALTAFLEAFVKLGFDTPFGFVTLFEETFELLRVTLLDFSVSCPPLPAPELLSDVGDDGFGDIMRLNIGTAAEFRQPGAEDIEDAVEIFGDRTNEEGRLALWAAGGLAGAQGAGYFDDGKLTHTEAAAAMAAGYLNSTLDQNQDADIDADEILAAGDLNENDTDNARGFALVIGYGEWEVTDNASIIFGDAGAEDDEIIGGDSVNVNLHIDGGDGDDEIIGGNRADILLGGGGADVVQGLQGNDDVSGDGTADASESTGLAGTGLVNRDLSAGTGIDVVFGGQGSDEIYGGGDNDQLFGGSEGSGAEITDGDLSDTIYAGSGEDAVQGHEGADLIYGGVGADNIQGNNGGDTIYAGSETDLVEGGFGADLIFGEGGNDILFGEESQIEATDPQLVGSFADTIYAGSGDDEVRGQFGNDIIVGENGDDRLIGGANDDTIYGGRGVDDIYGDRLPSDGFAVVAGADRIEGGADGDNIFGGDEENDLADFIMGGQSTAYTGADEFDGADLIRAGAGDDVVLGDDGTITDASNYATTTTSAAAANYNDRIFAGDGSDQVAGGHGDDLIFGDRSQSGSAFGQDIVFGDQAVRAGNELTATTDNDDGVDTIFGLNESDLLIGGGMGDGIFAGSGADLVVGDYAIISLAASGGTLYDRILRVASIDSTEGGDDRLLGEDDQDIIIGGAGWDDIFGGSDDGADILLGDHGLIDRAEGIDQPDDIYSLFGDQGGQDSIRGGAGADIIIGGNDSDQLFGQLGSDVILGDAGLVLRDANLDLQRVVSTFAEVDIPALTGIHAINALAGFAIGLAATDVVAAGDDDVDGGAGEDIVIGGLLEDLIFGRDGNDVLLGDNGDVLYDGAGTGFDNVTLVRTRGINGAPDGSGLVGEDAVFGEAGADIIMGGADNDLLFGDLTAEVTRGSYNITNWTSTGGGDRDVITGDNGALTLLGGDPAFLTTLDHADGGADWIEGHEGSDILLGGADRDIVHGEAPSVTISLVVTLGGQTENDVLLGDSGTVDWDGADGDIFTIDEIVATFTDGAADFLAGNRGDDVGFGGAGADLIYGDFSADVTDDGVTFTLSNRQGTSAGGDDVLAGDEGSLIRTGDDNVELIGLAQLGGADLIEGHNGIDALIGGAFSDALIGDAQASDFSGGLIMDAEAGDDALVGDSGLVQWRLDGDSSTIDFIRSSDDDAGVIGGDDLLLTNDGADIGIGGLGADFVLGDFRYDIDAAFQLVGGSEQKAASLTGSAANDLLAGDGATISQVMGNPILFESRNVGAGLGTGGADLVEGHDGSDALIGGANSDRLIGDAQQSDFALINVAGDDVILGDNGVIDWAFGADDPLADAFDATQGDGNPSTIDLVQTTNAAVGAADVILANDGSDIAMGGAGDDVVLGDLRANVDAGLAVSNRTGAANGGADILLGDAGQLIQANGLPLFLTSTDPGIGGDDLIEGHDLNDILIGGFGSDIIHGDFTTADAAGNTGNDIVFGDNGLIDWAVDGETDIDLIQSIAINIGDVDIVLGNDGDDILIGGQAGDQIYGDRTADVAVGTLVLSNEVGSGAGGGDGSDRIFGDNAQITYDALSDMIDGRPDIGPDGTVVTFTQTTDILEAISPNQGGDDLILGDGSNDLIIGGTGADRIWGDDGDIDSESVTDGSDLVFGDHGKLWETPGIVRGSSPFGDDYFSVFTDMFDSFLVADVANSAPNDLIFTEAGDDIALGGQGDDVIFGGVGNDDLVGGHNVQSRLDAMSADDLDGLNPTQIAAITGLDLADFDPTDLQEVNDVIAGEEGEDAIAGDNAIINREGVTSSPRFQTLDGDTLYSMVTADVPIPGLEATDFTVDLGFAPNIGTAVLDPTGPARTIELLDFDSATEQSAAANPASVYDASPNARSFGDDMISGGADDDDLFGQLGDDIVQGDGSIDLVDSMALPPIEDQSLLIPDGFFDQAPAGGLSPQIDMTVTAEPIAMPMAFNLLFNISSAAADGDDYIEGNGGNDRLFGNLGQDDIIGGSSNLFANISDGVGSALRPDGADLIYGDSGIPDEFLVRNADHLTVDNGLVDEGNFHVADADFIAGDNANIYRLTGLAADFAYTRDDMGALLDGYGTDGGVNLDTPLQIRVIELLDYAYMIDGSATNPETGAVDWQTTFDDAGVGLGDLIHGESGDDIIHGMTGDDLIFGEAGDDDIYGQAGADIILGGTGEDGILGDDGLLSTSRNGTAEPLFAVEATTQEVIRTPGNLQLAVINREGELNKAVDLVAFDLDGVTFAMDGAANPQMTSANDIVFGGLGDDWIHTGFGDDAVSGAEALPIYYDGGTDINDFLKVQQADLDGFAPVAEDPFWYGSALFNPGDILRFGARDPEEFAVYDENDPRSAIAFMFGGEIIPFLLNWDATEGPLDQTFTMSVNTDGADNIFGDLGNDWIVGGTGRDHMFGGRGFDLINMDDDLSTNGGANTDPDAYQEYADISYDGAGRDYVILNTGADRAIAWVGEYNSYIVPFSPFGAFHISRTLQPQTEQFVLDLARANGSDETTPDILRFAEQFAIDDKLDNPIDPDIYFGTGNSPGQAGRFGSPFNELGMVRQEDFDWQDQTGAPDDPQAGNDKGKRDIMRRELWMPEDTNGTQSAALTMQAEAEMDLVQQSFDEVYGDGVVTVHAAGVMEVSSGIEILADFSDQDVTAIRVDSIVEVEKAMKGLKANAFIVYDYISDADYKFAGVDVSRNKVQIGYRSGDDWVILAEVNAQLKADIAYDLSVQLVGNTVKISVDGTERLTYEFDESVLDGAIGLATNNAEASFTDTSVTAESDTSVDVGTTEDEASAVDWGDTGTDDGGDAGAATDKDADTGGASSSDSSTADGEQVVVSAWSPRDDFDFAAG